MAAEEEGRMIRLVSSDGQEFDVTESVAVQSRTVRHTIEDERCADGGILVPNVKGSILSKVLEFCNKQAESSAYEDDLKTWDDDFVKVDDQVVLFDLIVAADCLDIKPLLDLTCETVADTIKGMTPEEIRKFFDIKNESTAEEEDEFFDVKNEFTAEEEEEEIRRERLSSGLSTSRTTSRGKKKKKKRSMSEGKKIHGLSASKTASRQRKAEGIRCENLSLIFVALFLCWC